MTLKIINKKALIASTLLLAGSFMPAAFAAEFDGLEEIVVTAQKREQAYTDVPVAVSTYSGEVLDMAQVTEFQDLIQVSPSVTYTQSGGMRGSGINVRGIGTSAFQIGVEPTVSVVIDGITLGRTVQFLTDLNDIERIEVLRGPQGTLFGKNASAGLINIITKRPSDEMEGSIRLTATDDDMFGVTGQVSGSITDRVRGRLSFFKRDYDGYSKNAFNGDDINGDDSWGLRAKLDIDLSDRTNLYIIADYSRQDRDCCVAPRKDLGFGRFVAFDYQGINVDDENTDVLVDNEVYADTETWGLSVEVTHEFDNWVFTSLTGYKDFSHETQQDFDPYTGPTYGRLVLNSNGSPGNPQEQEQFSQEFRITSTAWDNFDLTAGFFYWDQSLDRYFERDVDFCVVPGAGDASLSPDPAVTPCFFSLRGFGWMDSQVNFENWAVFGQADWHLSDRWTASLGLRYTEDDIDFDFVRTSPVPGFLVGPDFTGSNDVQDDAVTGKLAVQFRPTDDMMFFASYAEGYKAPAFDIIFGLGPNRLDPVPAEESEAWEIGMKAELFDRRLRLGVTAFRTDFQGLQGQAWEPDELVFLLTSAGDARTEGVEIDFTWKPTTNLLINGGIAWVDATFEDFTGQQCYEGQTAAQGCVAGLQDLSGKDVPNSPDLKYAIQFRYDIPLETSFDMYVAGGYRWQDDALSSITQHPGSEIDSYDVADLSVGAESNDGRWMARIFAKNLMDDFYSDLVSVSPAFLGGGSTHFVQRDSMRYVGAEVEFRFGAL